MGKKKGKKDQLYPEGNWQAKISYSTGTYLRLADQTQTVIRGGEKIELPKNLGKPGPRIPIGQLDEYGSELLQVMLDGTYSIMEIVEFFANYEPQPGVKFNKKKFAKAHPPPTPPESESEESEEEEDEEVEEEEETEEEPEEPKDEEPKPEKPKKKKKEKKKEPPPYVFSLNDPDFLKIPYMHPDKKKHTFEEWFKILYSVCDPKGLTDMQCVDVMEFRMGGSYQQELRQMKREGRDLPYIELHFLKKDMDTSMIDKKMELVRSSLKEKWGIHMSYTLSDELGLHLVIDNVKSDSPAWAGGLRPLDCIVSIHGWIISRMKEAEVALSLFQACGNNAVVSILKSHGVTEEDGAIQELKCESWV